jgi:hypothetical protein
MLTIKKIRLFLGICFFVSLFFLNPSVSEAAVCDQNTTISFVARDPGGSYIMNARVDVYKQETDANGVTKPTTKLTGGNTDSVLGRVSLSWRNSTVSSATYAIRVQTISKDNASFWFYGIDLSCGENTSLERTLSGASFTLYDSDGDLLTNTGFNVYSQTTDANGETVKNELLASLNSGSTGRVKAYLPQGSVRSIDKSLSDYYVMEVTRNNVKSYFYNIQINDGQLTNVSYYLSVLKVRLKDANDNNATGAKVEVYNQDSDTNDNYVKGTKVGEFTISDNGYGSMEIANGTYMIAVKNTDGTYKYFWDKSVTSGGTSLYLLDLDKAYSSSSGSSGTSVSGVCTSNSNLTVILRNAAGDIAPGLKFELYTQTADANNLPAAGTKVTSGTINSGGLATVAFKPDTTKTYALKIWDKKSDLGEFWFFDAWKFTCGADRTIAKTVPVLKIILRDGSGALKRNYAFSLSAQQYDADNNPVILNNGLIANLTTDAGGQALVYVAPYNPYRRNQTGRYVVSAKNNSNTTVNLYNVIVAADKDTIFEARIKENAPSTSTTSSSSSAAPAAVSTATTASTAAVSSSLPQRLKGRIVLQVQDKGQAWYINPLDGKKYLLGKPQDAFNMMRRFGLGISNVNFAAVEENPSAWKNLAGRILLKTEDSGKAYYFDPLKLQLYYLGRPADAFDIIRSRGLGISNANLDLIATGK